MLLWLIKFFWFKFWLLIEDVSFIIWEFLVCLCILLSFMIGIILELIKLFKM